MSTPETVKLSSQKAVFSGNFFSENSVERFFRQPLGHKNTQEMLNTIKRHTLEAFSQVRRVVVNHRKGQKQVEKACYTSREFLEQTNF